MCCIVCSRVRAMVQHLFDRDLQRRSQLISCTTEPAVSGNQSHSHNFHSAACSANPKPSSQMRKSASLQIRWRHRFVHSENGLPTPAMNIHVCSVCRSDTERNFDMTMRPTVRKCAKRGYASTLSPPLDSTGARTTGTPGLIVDHFGAQPRPSYFNYNTFHRRAVKLQKGYRV